MEDVLDVYQRPSDPERPLVCLDETSRQVLGEVRAPLPPAPGRAARHDPEYARDGVVNLFLLSEPLRGRRHVRLSARRTRIDFAHCIKDLVDVHYAEAERIILVMDQLNTHSPASLYEAFPPAEAKRLADKLEIHYTPARQLAEHGRDRVECAATPVPGPPPGDPGDDGGRGRHLGGCPQRRRDNHRLALHHPGRPHQTHAPLPSVSRVTEH
jgi:DDE superfamily endonuclease